MIPMDRERVGAARELDRGRQAQIAARVDRTPEICEELSRRADTIDVCLRPLGDANIGHAPIDDDDSTYERAVAWRERERERADGDAPGGCLGRTEEMHRPRRARRRELGHESDTTTLPDDELRLFDRRGELARTTVVLDLSVTPVRHALNVWMPKAKASASVRRFDAAKPEHTRFGAVPRHVAACASAGYVRHVRDADSLRFDDVLTFLTVHNTRSISAAARQLQVTPSQVSKAVARLEEFVGAQLLARGSRGVAVSMAGLRVIPMLEAIARGVRDLKTEPDLTPMVRFAAPSSIGATVAGVLARSARSLRFSCLDLDPVRTRALAFEDVFDVALLADDRSLGELYTHERLGEIESCLFARPSLAARLGPGPVPQDALDGIPFVMPLLLQDRRVTGGRDLCPLPFEHRTQGHGAATFGAALEFATASDHLVFGPRVAARGHVARDEIVEIEVEGWSVRWTIYLACHTTRVQAKSARMIRSVLSRWLDESLSKE